MLKLVGETSVDMRRVWIESIKMLEHGLYFTAQHPVFFLESTAHIDLISQSFLIAANRITTVLQIFDVFDGCKDRVSEGDCKHRFEHRTFGENFPLARFSARRVREYVVQLIK